MTKPRFCEECGSALSATANFCANCGFALEGGVPSGRAVSGARGVAADPRASLVRALPWIIPSVAVIAVIAFAISSGRPGASDSMPLGSGFPGSAMDISQLSPDERADRLFNRVMSAASAGKMDTVAFFTPMAVGSFDALRPLTPHRHYDLGLIYLVSGEAALAQAEADSILAAAPKHLLGLALAMRAARASGDEAGRKRFAARFLAALPTERSRDVSEYQDHASDITDAVADAEGRTTAPTPM